MRIRNLLMLGAFLAMSGGVMAQTELTASNVNVIPGLKGELTLSLKTPAEVGGWQLYLVLPEGISLQGTEDKLKIGAQPDGGYPNATFFKDVSLSRGKGNHQVIGGINGEGQTLVICVPTAKEAKISGKSGELCKIKLLADDSFVGEKDGQIKGFLAADPKGETTYEAVDIPFTITQLKHDVNRDHKVNGTDIQKVINCIVNEDEDDKFDVNRDNKINGTDIQTIINYIVEEDE